MDETLWTTSMLKRTDYELAVAPANCDGRCSKVHSSECHSSGAKSWVAQVIERQSCSATVHTCGLVQRNAGGAQWTWKKVTIVFRSGAAENVVPKSMFPNISTEETERSKNGYGVQRTRRRAQQVLSVRTLEGFVRKCTWQVADVRRLLVSATHIIQGTLCARRQRVCA